MMESILTLLVLLVTLVSGSIYIGNETVKFIRSRRGGNKGNDDTPKELPN